MCTLVRVNCLPSTIITMLHSAADLNAVTKSDRLHLGMDLRVYSKPG